MLQFNKINSGFSLFKNNRLFVLSSISEFNFNIVSGFVDEVIIEFLNLLKRNELLLLFQ